MKTRIVLIAAALILIISVGFILWHYTHLPKKKIVVREQAVVVKEAAKKSQLPKIQKKYSNPKVVIVMDDFGYNMNNLDELFAIKLPVTFSVLPNLPYSQKIARLASSNGYEIILHQPMEANDKSAPQEAGTIKSGMNDKDVIALLEKSMSDVPGLSGISNHQGSKATEDKALMMIVLKELKKRKLFFFDSLVIQKSVCRDVAGALTVPYAKRDIFLDNTNSEDYIEKQVLALRRFAFRKGSAIAVCHDKKATITVLSKMMPQLAADGIVFTRLSEMVK